MERTRLSAPCSNIPRRWCSLCREYKIVDCFSAEEKCNSCHGALQHLQEKLQRRLGNYDFFLTHGCDLIFLYEWLEFTKRYFCPAPSLSPHIDHLIPLSRFERGKKEQMSFVNNWANLRYIYASHNMKKGASMPSKEDLLLQSQLCAKFLEQYNGSGYYSISLYKRCITIFNMFFNMEQRSYFYFTGRRRS